VEVASDSPHDHGPSPARADERLWRPLAARFGAAVRARRHELGLSQADLAEVARLHEVQISRVETGSTNVSMATIAALAAALQVEVSLLFAVGPTGEPAGVDAVTTNE